MKWVNNSLLFVLGGGAYVGLEKLWRGRSHWSMFLAGGTGFLLLGGLKKACPRLPRALRALAGGGLLTGLELAAGCLFNRRWQIWDYRGRPGNYLGQICPQFSALWVLLAAAGEGLHTFAQGLLTAAPASRGLSGGKQR